MLQEIETNYRFFVLAMGVFTLGTSHTEALLDLDENGYSDVWERKFEAYDLNPFQDPDEDGAVNIMEHQAGTDPNDPDSVLKRAGWIEYWDNQMIVGWKTVRGMSYELNESQTMVSGSWAISGPVVFGTGDYHWAKVVKESPRSFIRIKNAELGARLSGAYASLLNLDTDLDGISDWNEWIRGSDIFVKGSQHFSQPVIKTAKGISLSWDSQLGKVYQLESRLIGAGGNWKSEGPVRAGTGGKMEVVIPLEDSAIRAFSLWVEDADSDNDGLTDWEEEALGLRPDLDHTNHLGTNDFEKAIGLLAEPNVIQISAPDAIGNVTRSINGSFEIRRLSGVDALEIQLSTTGDAVAGIDFEELPDSVMLPFGKSSVTIPLIILPTASVSTSEEVLVTVEETSSFNVAGDGFQTINLISENMVNVRDYGASGDGLSDDRDAIQLAIEALENDLSKNTLYFPKGLYNLASFVSDSRSTTSRNRILKLGNGDLSGRDLVIAFDEEAVLYSSVSPIRAHMLECIATFRSLSFYNSNFEKNSIPLGEPLKVEPNGADGVSLVMHDLREVEMIQFLGCRFFNCHGPISTYGSGFSTRGKLRYFRLKGCSLLCPWGANSIDDSKIWGGGQMVNILPWVGTAEYTDNYFDGGSQVRGNPLRNPLDRKKDGSHFGSPLRLVFERNTVDHMRVEAVYQLHNPLLGFTNEEIVLPGEGEEISFRVSDHPSEYRSGEKIAIRGPIQGKGSVSVSLTISNYDLEERRLSVRNDGDNPFPLETVPFSARKPIYLQGDFASEARISDNVVRALNEEGRRSAAGIVANARALIYDNYVEGYGVGIQIYGNSRTPLTPGSLGTLIENNVIYTANGSENPTSTTYGIQSWGPRDMIRSNLVITPVSKKVIGIALRGNDSTIRDNIVIAKETVDNGYSNLNRAVGIGVGNTSSEARIEGNSTRGFDVGIGPANPFQSIPHYVSEHRSFSDVLPRDFRGAIEE